MTTDPSTLTTDQLRAAIEAHIADITRAGDSKQAQQMMFDLDLLLLIKCARAGAPSSRLFDHVRALRDYYRTLHGLAFAEAMLKDAKQNNSPAVIRALVPTMEIIIEHEKKYNHILENIREAMIADFIDNPSGASRSTQSGDPQ